MSITKKIGTGTALLAAGIILCAPLNNAQAKSAYKTITPTEAKQKTAADKKIILLDVRTIEEYAEKHIAGTMLIPLDKLQNDVLKKIPNKNSTVFIYCRSGRRSKIAADMMLDMGYINIYDLGGIQTWPYETVTGK